MYGHLDWWGVHLPQAYLHSSISATYLIYWCSRYVWSFGVVGVHLTLVHMHVSISATYFMYCCSRDVSLFWGVHLPWVYLHSSMSTIYLMYQCSRDVWSWKGGPSDFGICAFCIYTTSFPYKCHCSFVILLLIPYCSFTIRYE